MKHIPFLVFSLMISLQLEAKIWTVGPAKTYKNPSAVATLVGSGDTVNIDAGIYESDVAYWKADNLLIRGVGGLAHLKSNGKSYGSKAIWVIGGNQTTIESIEFSGCVVPDKNGAGIRQEGRNLTVRNCYFHDNETGILAGTVKNSSIRIEFSEFGHNGNGDGYSHNLYINNIDTLVFQFNYSHHAKIGHELKSRASVNYILYNRLSDEATGTASRNIDIPNGGTTYLIGNVIEQGPATENSNIIGYGLEGLINPSPNELYAVNNTIVNNRNSGSFFHLGNGTTVFKAWNNILAGPGTFLIGSAPTLLDTATNLVSVSIPAVGFVDASKYDFKLNKSASLAIDRGTATTALLSPMFTYGHPTSRNARCISGKIDLGAYEYCASLGNNDLEAEPVDIFPNPTRTLLTIHTSLPFKTMELWSSTGILTLSKSFATELELNGIASGLYYLKLINSDLSVVRAVMILP